ncbi:MAG: hypothetical protein L6Q54_10795 [Leptospiraceae bacterium]|nr:hypothetical protein [Leptospiraceae bacterium]MCK6381715.1 hypothetical protein [Leptospiraceae bacterium]
MKQLTLLFLILILNCNTPKKEDSVKKEKSNSDSTNQNLDTTKKEELEEFISPKEGFVTQSVFQVVVFSLSDSLQEAKREALDIAKRKSINLLISNTRQPLSSQGRNEIKSIVEESGKITKESSRLEGKYYFIYKIEKPGLEILIKDKLN